jgi:hypothetical protein
MTMAALLAFGIVSAAHAEVSMEKVAAGERGGIAAARQVVVRSEAEWQQLWSELGSRQAIPKVDFEARMVVGVFLGTRPTSGFSVQIVEVRDESGVLSIRYAERGPSPGAMVLQALTAPFYLASVPARRGEVRFEQISASPRPIR